jgi:hypothetical protein
MGRIYCQDSRGDQMKKLANANAWCPYCDTKLTIDVSQPYRDYTYRVEFKCKNYSDCDEHGIVMLMEVKE